VAQACLGGVEARELLFDDFDDPSLLDQRR